MMSVDEHWSVTAELAYDGNTECALLKVGGAKLEANFWIPLADLARFKLIGTTSRPDGSVRIGRSAGASTFWSPGEAGDVTVVIGGDDETWDIGFNLPEAVFKEILVEIEVLLER